VFHSNEVIATVRHHIPDEPGVIPVGYSSPPPLTAPPLLIPADPSLTHNIANVTATRRQIVTSPPSPHFFSSSPLESPELAPSPDGSSPDLFPILPSHSPLLISRTPSSQQTARLRTGDSVARYTSEEPPVRTLKAGDMLHWHQLSKTGEIPGVEEDARARTPNWHHSGQFFDR